MTLPIPITHDPGPPPTVHAEFTLLQRFFYASARSERELIGELYYQVTEAFPVDREDIEFELVLKD